MLRARKIVRRWRGFSRGEKGKEKEKKKKETIPDGFGKESTEEKFSALDDPPSVVGRSRLFLDFLYKFFELEIPGAAGRCDMGNILSLQLKIGGKKSAGASVYVALFHRGPFPLKS